MPFISAQKSTEYYQKYKDIQVTMTKNVIKMTGFLPSEIWLKCAGYQYTCIVYSTSMASAKLLMKIDNALSEKFSSVNNQATLRYSFMEPDTGKKIAFLVPGKISGYTDYKAANDEKLQIVNFVYLKRPADDLIAAIGNLLEVNIASKKRSEVRIDINDSTLRQLGILSKSINVTIDKIPRKAILRDISFGGMKIIIFGIAKFLINKRVVIRLPFDQEGKFLNISGIILRSEDVVDRKELAALAVKLDDNAIPMLLKTRINEVIQKIKR